MDLIILIERYFLLFKTGVMNNKTNKKLLVLSVIFLVFWAAIAIATTVPSNNYLKVKPILNRAIQSIQSITFNEDAVRHADKPDREIILESNHGTVMIRWRVLASTSWVTNTLTPESTGSSLFYWRDNYLAWTDSFIIAWVHDIISTGVSNSTIIWWTNNTLKKWDNIHIIWGSGNKIISWTNSYIVGGQDNELEWDNSYIIWWSNTKVSANHSFAIWSDININKDYVFAWKDRSDDIVLTPNKENTFTWFAQNWISIGYWTTNNTDPWTVDINWGFQISSEKRTCALNIAWTIQYIGWQYWCFCLCNGSTWESLTHSKNCRVSCSHLTWDVGDNWIYVWVCRYKSWQQLDWSNAKVWAIDETQWCDNWMAINFKTVTNADWSLKWWTWQCIWNADGVPADECAADATIQEWVCSTTNFEGISDYYTKCKSWYPTNISSEDKKTWLVNWTCMGVNNSVSAECKWCAKNQIYNKKTGKCSDETGKCNSNYTQTLSSLINSKEICLRWNIANFKTGYTEDKRIAWWSWDCVWTWVNWKSVASCSASYKSEPWRCSSDYLRWVSKYDGYTWLANYLSCNKWVVTWVVFHTGTHEVTWVCSGVNYDRNAYCWSCDKNSTYNRHFKGGRCELNTCDYTTWIVYTGTEIDNYWAWEVSTCDRKITIMDRNLWATTNDITKIWSYWDYFQFGNNNWFTLNEAKTSYTSGKVAWSPEYDKKGYSWDRFIIQNENDSCPYDYWIKDGSCTVHPDVWWWSKDWWAQWYTTWFYHSQWWMDTLYRVHQNDIDDYIENRLVLSAWNQHIDLREYMLNTWAIARRWPCPKWWHVPSLWEWWALLNDWCLINHLNNNDVCKGASFGQWKVLWSITNIDDIDKNFLNAFKLPKAWRLLPVSDSKNPVNLVGAGDEWFYWGSSVWSNEQVWYAWFYLKSLYPIVTDWEMRWWLPIRCFKNPEIIKDDERNS